MVGLIEKYTEKNKEDIYGEDNPILISSDRISSLKDHVLKAVVFAAKDENLTEEETEYLIKIVNEVYLEKKAKHFFQSKMVDMTSILSNMFSNISKKTRTEESKHLFYYNRTKHSLKNEW